MDVVSHMHTFVRVVEAGSLSAAARSMRLSVPAVSRQLRALEDELGAPLILRTTRRLTLTEAGQRFLDHALRVLREVESALASVRPAAEVKGALIVSASVTWGLVQLMPHLPAFLAAHPALEVELRLEDRAVELVGEGVDVAIRGGMVPPDSAALIAHPFVTYRRYAVAAPSYLRSHGMPVHPSMLAAHAAIVGGSYRGQTQRWRFWERGESAGGAGSKGGAAGAGSAASPGSKEIAVEVRGRLRVDTLLACRDAAIAGLGIAYLPEFLVAEAVSDGRLQIVCEDFATDDATIYALHRIEVREVPRIAAFVQYLKDLNAKPAENEPNKPKPAPRKRAPKR